MHSIIALTMFAVRWITINCLQISKKHRFLCVKQTTVYHASGVEPLKTPTEYQTIKNNSIQPQNVSKRSYFIYFFC